MTVLLGEDDMSNVHEEGQGGREGWRRMAIN